MGRKTRFIAAALAADLTAGAALALPSFEPFVKEESGATVSCFLCHQRGSRRLTPYAGDYVRLGGGRSAVATLNTLDSDTDGVATVDELKVRSNPGDARSQPDHPGPWLAAGDRAVHPTVPLRMLFREDIDFSAANIRLTSAQITRIEHSLGEKLPDEARHCTLYTVRRPKGPVIGYAVYAYFLGESGYTTMLLAVKPDLTIQGLTFASLHIDRRFSKHDYLKQYENLALKNLQTVVPPAGQENAGAQVTRALAAALKTIELIAAAPAADRP